ncbi:endonuclease [Tenacibaculum aquimarinum]|uniref:endonuclease n=1 Tax=Tenacibaculum aquimarinum TaxID=2910675 RepID=UPI001F0A05E6|nr:endonuclease [Tenacibaculum aquimarinum]MCH3885342.1 endonuclease [Tenacibaculum aquimarinum]
MVKKLLSLLFITSISLSFAQEAYYSDVDLTLAGTDLKDALATKIIATHTNMLSYTPGVWEASKITDANSANTSEVVLIYGWEDGSDSDITNDRERDNTLQDNGSGATFVWNREHVFSKSLANPALVTNNPGAGTDAHNLRPADKSRNSARNNYKFALGSGNSSRSSVTYNGPDGPNTAGWYPGDEWKGDAARIIMYMYLRYGEQCLPTAVGVGDNQFTQDDMIDLFLQWNVEDPVSDIEKTRNTYHEDTTNNTYAQGNRNPFIDNPYLATRIWGGDSAEDLWNLYTPTDTQAPSVPANVTVSNENFTSLDVTWDASTDNEAVTGYNIYVDGTLTAQTTTNTTITLTDLNPNTTYSITVLSKDFINNFSNESAPVNGATLQDTTAPTAPTNATASTISDSSFVLTWDAATDDNSVESYDVYLDGVLNSNVTTLTYTIINLSATTNYTAYVIAKDTSGNPSAQSNTVNVTTTAGGSGTATELFFSEYTEGNGGTNKALEIVNLTGATIDLTGYVLKLERNGAAVWTTPLALNSGSVQSIVPNDVFVVGNGDNSDPILQPNSASNPTGEVDLVQPNNQDTNFGQPVNFNGNDAVGLFKNDVLIDIIGIFGDDSNFAKDVTLRRKTSITSPNTTYTESEWDSFPENTFDDIGNYDTSALSTEDAFFESFKMFPNPTNGNSVYFSVTEDATIQVYSTLGKLISTQKVTKSNNRIDVSNLSKGVYLLKINSEKRFITKKLIKN